jgi:adenylylsulfate kinase
MRRSVVKAITYRAVIMTLDFLTICFLSGKLHVAVTFMVVSNLYTSAVYLLHERLWAHISWGIVNRQ